MTEAGRPRTKKAAPDAAVGLREVLAADEMRRQAEEALGEREAIFRSIVEQAVDAIGLVDPATGRFIEFNDAACRNLGYSREEFAALTLGDVDLNWPGERIVQALADLKATGVNVFETRHRRKDGEIRDVRVSASMIDVAGRACFSGLWSDITDSRRLTEELARYREHLEQLVVERTEALGAANRIAAEQVIDAARSRQNFDTFFNTIDDLLFVLDGRGNMIHVNETVRRRLGYSEAELIGRSVLDVHPPERRDEAGRIVAAMLAGEADVCPVPVVARDGTQIAVETRVVPGVWDGEPALFGVTKDVTALKRSEEKFQRLFHGNPNPMAVSDLPDRRFTDVNDAWLEVLGYSREQALGRTSEELDLFPDPEQQRAVAEELQATGHITDVELKVRRRDDTIVDGLFSGEIIESAGQQHFLTVMVDLTERKAAEAALRESEEKYRTVADFTYDWEAWSAPDGMYRWVSPSCERITGHTAAEFLAEPTLSIRIAHPDDRAKVVEHFGVTADESHGQDEELEYRLVTPAGQTRWISHWCTDVHAADGTWLGRRASNRDITDRKQAEETLRQVSARLSLATRAGGVGTWDLDPVTGTLTWDDQMFRLYGITAEQFSGAYDAWQAGVHPDDRERGDAEIKAALRGEKEFDTEFRVLWPDGTVRDIRALALVQHDGSGRAVRIIGTNWDITERKAGEEALLLQAQKMETVGHLAGGIAHDFSNLLVVVAGNAEIVREELPPDDPRQASIAEIEEAARRGAALTRQLLAFSRRQVVQPEVLDLNVVVGEIREMLKSVIGAGIELRFEPGEPLGAVRADASRLGQVLMNLIVNARDAMPAGGTITIATRDVVLTDADAVRHTSLAPGRYVTLAVTDTGTGMDAATRARIFEPFFTTKAQGSGTGLGLATVLRIAQQSGGAVDIESEPGQGSTFTLYLPTTDVPVLAPVAAPVAPPEPGGETILLVDDDPGVRRLTERILVAAGHPVLTAADGVEALALLAAHPAPVHLLLTDLILPRMGGTEIARRVAEARPGTRILLMSGYPADIVAGAGVLPAGTNLVEKPFTPAELTAAVREVLDRPG